MVKFINRITKTVMYVEDDRKDEYIRAGHKLVEDNKDEAKPDQKPVAKKRTTKKK